MILNRSDFHHMVLLNQEPSPPKPVLESNVAVPGSSITLLQQSIPFCSTINHIHRNSHRRCTIIAFDQPPSDSEGVGRDLIHAFPTITGRTLRKLGGLEF